MPEVVAEAAPEVYFVTPRDLALVFLIQVALIVVASLAVAWATRSPKPRERDSQSPDGREPVRRKSAEETRRRTRRQPNTGVTHPSPEGLPRASSLHVPGETYPADETVVIEKGEPRR